MDIRRTASIKDSENIIGNRTKVKVVKNKVAPPFRDAEFDIMYGTGISREGDVIDVAVRHNIIQKSGTWFSYGEERLGQGRENVKQYLTQNPDLLKKIALQAREALGLVKKVESKAKNGKSDQKKTPTPQVVPG